MPHTELTSSLTIFLELNGFDWSTWRRTYSIGFSLHNWYSLWERSIRGRDISYIITLICSWIILRVIWNLMPICTLLSDMHRVLVPTNCWRFARMMFKWLCKTWPTCACSKYLQKARLCACCGFCVFCCPGVPYLFSIKREVYLIIGLRVFLLLTLKRVCGWSERRFPWASNKFAYLTLQSAGYPQWVSQTEDRDWSPRHSGRSSSKVWCVGAYPRNMEQPQAKVKITAIFLTLLAEKKIFDIRCMTRIWFPELLYAASIITCSRRGKKTSTNWLRVVRSSSMWNSLASKISLSAMRPDIKIGSF